MGKTTLTQALSTVLGLQQKRIQFTVDVMPGDVLKDELWDPSSQTLVWKNGPIFTEVLLADELNRTTPRTQAALLGRWATSELRQRVNKLPLLL